jgi:hypothetical protein
MEEIKVEIPSEKMKYKRIHHGNIENISNGDVEIQK